MSSRPLPGQGWAEWQTSLANLRHHQQLQVTLSEQEEKQEVPLLLLPQRAGWGQLALPSGLSPDSVRCGPITHRTPTPTQDASSWVCHPLLVFLEVF